MTCGYGAEEDARGFTETFPDIPCVSKIFGGLSLRLSIDPENGLAFRQDLGQVGNTPVDW